MAESQIIYAFIFGLLMLGSYMAGWWTTSRNYMEAAKDRQELRDERRELLEENRRLSAEVFDLRERVIELEAKLAAAMGQISELSSSLNPDNM